MPFAKLLRNLLLWLVPTFIVWTVATPTYNRFLTRATNSLIQLAESPNRTSLKVHDDHHFLIYRTDLRRQTSTGHVASVRVTDTQFMAVFAVALFLAVPGASWRRTLSALGWALLILVFFHILSLVFWVEFMLATQQDQWSAERYSVFFQNFWGLGKHLLDLPFKFAMPLILWTASFFKDLAPEQPFRG